MAALAEQFLDLTVRWLPTPIHQQWQRAVLQYLALRQFERLVPRSLMGITQLASMGEVALVIPVALGIGGDADQIMINVARFQPL